MVSTIYRQQNHETHRQEIDSLFPEEFTKFTDTAETGLTQKRTQQLHRITKGWIAGAVLWLLYSDSEATADRIPADNTPENIFAYFAAEIFAKTDPPIQSFLLQTALLPHMTSDMAGELTDMEAEDILEHLSRNNFFIEKRQLAAVSYQYHPLFREFLQVSAAREYSASSLRSLHRRAAEILEKHGMREEAINLYFKADVHEPITPIILELAPALVAQGRYIVLLHG